MEKGRREWEKGSRKKGVGECFGGEGGRKVVVEGGGWKWKKEVGWKKREKRLEVGRMRRVVVGEEKVKRKDGCGKGSGRGCGKNSEGGNKGGKGGGSFGRRSG